MPALPRQLDAIRLAAGVLRAQDDPAVRDVGCALATWLASGAAGSVDQALALRSVGGVSPARALLLAERDDLLRDLHRQHWPDLAPAAAARVMWQSFDRYERHRAPRERDAIQAPAGEPAAAWWRILRSGAPMPGVERLRQLLS